MVKFMNIPNTFCTFAVLLGGKRLRRGASFERLGVDMGRLIACTNLTLIGLQPVGMQSYLFLYCSTRLPSVKKCWASTAQKLREFKSRSYLNADSNKSVIFAASNLKLISFMVQLQVQVFANDVAKANNRKLFERVKDVDDNITIDYNGIAKTLRFLYGNNCIISFNILPL